MNVFEATGAILLIIGFWILLSILFYEFFKYLITKKNLIIGKVTFFISTFLIILIVLNLIMFPYLDINPLTTFGENAGISLFLAIFLTALYEIVKKKSKT
ncbi:hypothetical protein DRO97_07870 [Archaeoglobales archaeon]|mgnify:CR=1 FL=1|nr:MAG: hypothetical protein DRO97_07870 [Archaeoglobales archaeon]